MYGIKTFIFHSLVLITTLSIPFSLSASTGIGARMTSHAELVNRSGSKGGWAHPHRSHYHRGHYQHGVKGWRGYGDSSLYYNSYYYTNPWYDNYFYYQYPSGAVYYYSY